MCRFESDRPHQTFQAFCLSRENALSAPSRHFPPDLFAFLTTEASEPVKSAHPKAMPVILTEPEEIETWMARSVG